MSTAIFGPTQTTIQAAEDWAIERGAHSRFVAIFPHYYRLAPIYQIPAEVGIGQSSHETNDWKYTGAVTPDQHNMCGLKTRDATGDRPEDHATFPDDATGVEAHLQHLRKYGGRGLPEGRPLYDPRYNLIARSVDTVEELGGLWAPSPTYGVRVAERIASLRGAPNPVPEGDMPGVLFISADRRHYTPGRTVEWTDKIMHHHTDGYNSLTWLTISPDSTVSATYLMNRDGTFRAQLVRHHDTPHTNSGHNYHTLTMEWERKWGVPEQLFIPDDTYRNLGHADAEIVRVERRRGNPNFMGQPQRSWLGDHNDVADTICPGNLDVDIIYGYMLADLATDDPAPAPDPDEFWLPGAAYPFKRGFAGHLRRIGAAVFPDDPAHGALAVFGYPQGEEYPTATGSAQRTERYVLEWQRGVAPPFDIVGVIRGQKIPERME